MTRSLGTASSNPSEGKTPTTHHEEAVRDGEAAPSDWRYWYSRAYQAWAARSEQLNLFVEPVVPVKRRYTQIRELPGATFEEMFQR